MGSAMIALLIASLIGTVVSAGFNAYNVNKTNQQNKDLAAMQNQWNLEQWQRQNAYNEPQSQVQRLAAAGINPALAVGQSGLVDAGNAQQSHPAAGATMQPFQMEDLGSFGRTGLSAMVQQSQIDANKAYAKNQTAQANDINQMLPEKIRHIQAEVDNLKEQNNVLQQQVTESVERIKNLSQDRAESAFRILHGRALETFQEMDLELKFKEFGEFCKKNSADINKIYSSIGVDKATIKNLSSLTKINNQNFWEMQQTYFERLRGLNITNDAASKRLEILGFDLDNMRYNNPFSTALQSPYTSHAFKNMIVGFKYTQSLVDGFLQPFKGLMSYSASSSYRFSD